MIDTVKPERYAVLYARFSPRKNASESESNEHQIAELREYCALNGLTVVAEFQDDAFSGGDADRPGIWAALAALKRGYVLVIRNFDRLARDTLFSLMYQDSVRKLGAEIIALQNGGEQDNSPGAELYRGILFLIAEFNRKMMNATTKAAILRHQANGRRMSKHLPYGWRLDESSPRNPVSGLPTLMVPDEAELAVVQRIVGLRQAGSDWRGIGHVLEAEGILCRGGRWHGLTIKKIAARVGQS